MSNAVNPRAARYVHSPDPAPSRHWTDAVKPCPRRITSANCHAATEPLAADVCLFQAMVQDTSLGNCTVQPVVGISADSETLREIVPAIAVYDTYVDAVVHGAGAMPWIVPPIGEYLDVDGFLGRIDGLLLTGSLSNVEPHHYDGETSEPGTLHDPKRDETVLPMVLKALDLGVPFLGICRGYQELNVALGGTLHQKVHDLPGMLDHRAPQARSMAERFVDQHDVEILPGGILADICVADTYRINSLHEQGIDSLAPRLAVEAQAPDGLVEAVRVADAESFALAVQWHPEWQFHSSPINHAIWQAFGVACRERAHTSKYARA